MIALGISVNKQLSTILFVLILWLIGDWVLSVLSIFGSYFDISLRVLQILEFFICLWLCLFIEGRIDRYMQSKNQ